MKKADEFLTVSRKISFPGDFFFLPSQGELRVSWVIKMAI